MDPLENNYSVTRNQDIVGLSIHSTSDTLVVTSYLLLVLFFGLWALLSHRRGTIKDFFLAGQNLAWWLMGISTFSANISSGHYMGLAGIGATSGIAVGALEWNTICMFYILGWIFVPIYNKAEVVTLPEYLGKRFGSLRIQLFSTFFSLVVYIFSRISMEISFGAMFLKMVWDTDIYQTMLVLLTITGIYTITGGLATVAYVETLQAGIMLLGSVLLMIYVGSPFSLPTQICLTRSAEGQFQAGGIYTLNQHCTAVQTVSPTNQTRPVTQSSLETFREVGGYQGLMKKYLHAIPSRTQQGNWTAKPQCYMPRRDAFHIFRSFGSGDIPWPGLILGATAVSLFYGCADQVSVQRFLAGKSSLDMKGGCLLCGYLKLLPMFLMVMPGMVSRILFPDQVACAVPSECQKYCGGRSSCSALAYPVLVIGVMPSGLKGFMLSTLCASIMSSLSSVFNSSSALFTLNIYTWIRPLATEKELMIAGRFFVIILLSITIVWIPTIEMVSSEALFEYMQVLKSCLTPSVAAVFLLAVFCKRVNEQGAFWGLVLGTAIGAFRLLAEFFYGPSPCEGGRACPTLICGLHYLYFGFFLFLVTLLTTLAVSLATKPISDVHLHGLCWSLRNSQQRRVTLGKEMRWKVFPSSTFQQGMFGETNTCFWKFWDLFCGLDAQAKTKIGPENTTEEKRKATWEQMGSSDTSVSLEILARRMATRKSEEHQEKMKDWSDIPESPFWKRVVDASGILLFALLMFVHVYYA